MFPRFCVCLCRFAGRSKTQRIRNAIAANDASRTSFPSHSQSRTYCLNSEIIDKPALLPAIQCEEGYKSDLVNVGSELESDKRLVEKKSESQAVSKGVRSSPRENQENDLADAAEADALDECTEDVSHIRPLVEAPRTFAYMAERSETVQQLMKLGVQLYKLEKNKEQFLNLQQLDFDHDIKGYIEFLCDNGVPADHLGKVISRCPDLLLTDSSLLSHRIKYLQAHKFSKSMIANIIARTPEVLLITTKKLDSRLGYIKKSFDLTASELRSVVSKQPRLILRNEAQIIQVSGHITQVMQFDKHQTKELLLSSPAIWTKGMKAVMESCEYALDQMKLSHEDIVKNSPLLLCKRPRLERRHMFLVELKRAQFDPTMPGYVSPRRIVLGSDAEFCQEVAQCDPDLYNVFLKSF